VLLEPAEMILSPASGDRPVDQHLPQSSRHAVGVFADAGRLGEAYRELETAGFGADDLCLMATSGMVNGRTGGRGPRQGDLRPLSGEEARSAYDLLRNLTASGAYCAAGSVYSSTGSVRACLGRAEEDEAGDWLADLLGTWIARHAAEYLEDRLAEGKALLWARVGQGDDPKREHLACTILLNHSSESVRVLDFSYRA
jgi:hypothetical protein